MPMFRTMHRTSIMLGILLLSGGAGADDLVGQASVIDGEEIHQKRIRLWGIDAPETSQLCRGADSDLYRFGAKAANDLDSFIAGRPVNCTPVAERPIWADCGNLFRRRCRHRRMACAQWSRAGLAAIFEGKYGSAQRDADRSGRGMWAGSYVEPWLFRAGTRAGGTPTNCSDDANAHP